MRTYHKLFCWPDKGQICDDADVGPSSVRADTKVGKCVAAGTKMEVEFEDGKNTKIHLWPMLVA